MTGPTTTKVMAWLLVALLLNDTDNRVQELEMELAKILKDKQLSYITVLESDLKPELKNFFESKSKQKLVNTKDALDKASVVLDALDINSTVFDQMNVLKRQELVKAMSLELELTNLITLTKHSIDSLGYDVATLVNNYTQETYSDELFFRQMDFETTQNEHFYLNSKRGLFQQFETANPLNITRIRNRISAGLEHVLVLMPNGKLYSTGVYNEGNLGRTVQDSRLLYKYPVEGLDGLEIYQFEANRYSNLVLTNKGVYSFGLNDRSQLATGGTKTKVQATFVNGFSMGNKIEQIALGYNSAFAIDEYGKLWAWGANDQGQLGDRTFDDKNRPFAVYQLLGPLRNRTVVRVCAGQSHTIALTSDNILVSFGDNTFGQLGTNDTVTQGEPVKVKLNNLQGRQISDIQCGTKHNLLLTTDGMVYSWGSNENGQLGDGSTLNSLVPIFVSYLYNNLSCVAERIHTRGFVNFVICSDKRLFSWGKNDIGQTGTGSIGSNILRPTLVKHSLQPIVDISSNEDNSFIFYADGSIQATGKCPNTLMFMNHECIDLNPPFWNNVTVPKRFVYHIGGTFTNVNHQNNMNLVWYHRKPIYFDMGDLAYLLKQENTIPTRRNNGFNMYVSNITKGDYEWKLIEFNAKTGTGFPDSIYNSHMLKRNEYVYLFGGFVNDEVSNSVYRCPIYDLQNDWELCNFTLPVPVASGMLVPIGDYVYIFGGITSMYSYNSTTDFAPRKNAIVTDKIMRAPLSDLTSWEIMSDVLPVPIHSAFWEIVGNYVYLFGGSRSVGTSQINIFRATLQTPWIWEHTFGILPYYMINTGQVASTNDTMYAFGGTNATTGVGGPYMAYGNKSDITGSWMAINDPTRTQAWCKKYPLLCFYCYGVEASNPNVCSAAGKCLDYDKCQCTNGRYGDNCEKSGIIALSGIRKYSDGTYATSCNAYKNPTNISRVYQGITGDGWYWIKPDLVSNPMQVYCDMTTDGGGWTVYYTVGTTYSTVNLLTGVPSSGLNYDKEGYFADLKRVAFTDVMFTTNNKKHWFKRKTSNAVIVNNYRSGYILNTNFGDPYYVYGAIAGTMDGGGLFSGYLDGVLDATTDYKLSLTDKTLWDGDLPVSAGLWIVEYAYRGTKGYRANAVGITRKSTCNWSSCVVNCCSDYVATGICFQESSFVGCATTTPMTVLIR
ncbi:hypothetical protein FDP41_001825 [Naegleria fowleri]|uniref:EGF-like domain-containing protein n=1 Tax=Naegleria fowleri TaxID=5763 RepID=A0A6A5BZJ7_NAEFO|nr:uncharacterized protein FDP41_001825 [Naegleria fowleri]KAF0978755.1 hypothetical protein FDP41_001825 [Naegleria fowleri]